MGWGVRNLDLLISVLFTFIQLLFKEKVLAAVIRTSLLIRLKQVLLTTNLYYTVYNKENREKEKCCFSIFISYFSKRH